MNASMNITIHPCTLNGTQLNIFPINWKGAKGTAPAFTISACTMMIAKNTLRKPVFSLSPLNIPKPSSLTLNPLKSALAIKSTKYPVRSSSSLPSNRFAKNGTLRYIKLSTVSQSPMLKI